MKIIGLCGGSGSGKGCVSDIFAELGIPSVDTDAVYREITSTDSPCLRALVREFGEGIISESRGLDRKALAAIVFASGAGDKLARLNEITHTHILAETRSRLRKYADEGLRAAIVDAPLLFESGFNAECDIIIAVVADRDIRIQRIIARDGISRDAAERRIDSQICDGELISRSHCFIVNNGDIELLRKSVYSIAEKISE